MNIPKGYVLVPLEPTRTQLVAGLGTNGIHPIYCAMVAAAPPVELAAYDEAKERELFTAFAMESFLSVHRGEGRDYFYAETEAAWLGWKACAKSRDRSAE